jgi:hypothetical protein
MKIRHHLLIRKSIEASDCVMAQAVRRWLHSARARVQSRTGEYWWRKEHWNGFFCESFSLDPSVSSRQCSVFIFMLQLFIRMTSGRSLRTCKHRNTLSDMAAASARREFSRFLKLDWAVSVPCSITKLLSHGPKRFLEQHMELFHVNFNKSLLYYVPDHFITIWSTLCPQAKIQLHSTIQNWRINTQNSCATLFLKVLSFNKINQHYSRSTLKYRPTKETIFYATYNNNLKNIIQAYISKATRQKFQPTLN